MTAPRTYDALETAAAVGLSVSRWRKVWRSFVTRRGFPWPLKGGEILPGCRCSREPFAWSAEAVDAWVAARTSGGLRPTPTPPPAILAADAPPANDRHPFDRPDHTPTPRLARMVARDRAQLHQLMLKGA